MNILNDILFLTKKKKSYPKQVCDLLISNVISFMRAAFATFYFSNSTNTCFVMGTFVAIAWGRKRFWLGTGVARHSVILASSSNL